MKNSHKLIYVLIAFAVVVIIVSALRSYGVEGDKIEWWFNAVQQLLVITGLILGIVLGYPLLERGLRDDNIKEVVKDIQASNIKVGRSSVEVIDYLIEAADRPDFFLEKKDIEELREKIRSLYYEAFIASKEIATILSLLHELLIRLLREFGKPEAENIRVPKGRFYQLILTALQRVVFFATKAVVLPASSKTKEVSFLNERLANYVSDNEFKKFADLERGASFNTTNSILINLLGEINSLNQPIVSKSFAKIHLDPSAILRILHLHEVYIPPVIRSDKAKSEFGKMANLYLVSFELITEHHSKEDAVPKKVIKALYANLNAGFVFASTLTKDMLVHDYTDDFFGDQRLSDWKVQRYIYHGNEVFEITVDRELAEQQYQRRKAAILQKMKEDIK